MIRPFLVCAVKLTCLLLFKNRDRLFGWSCWCPQTHWQLPFQRMFQGSRHFHFKQLVSHPSHPNNLCINITESYANICTGLDSRTEHWQPLPYCTKKSYTTKDTGPNPIFMRWAFSKCIIWICFIPTNFVFSEKGLWRDLNLAHSNLRQRPKQVLLSLSSPTFFISPRYKHSDVHFF